MLEWEEDIGASETIFIRASTHGKKSFMGYDGAVLEKNDARIRTFPFPTRRPVGGLFGLVSAPLRIRHNKSCYDAGTS